MFQAGKYPALRLPQGMRQLMGHLLPAQRNPGGAVLINQQVPRSPVQPARGFSISQNCLNERGHAGIALAEDLLLFAIACLRCQKSSEFGFMLPPEHAHAVVECRYITHTSPQILL